MRSGIPRTRLPALAGAALLLGFATAAVPAGVPGNTTGVGAAGTVPGSAAVAPAQQPPGDGPTASQDSPGVTDPDRWRPPAVDAAALPPEGKVNAFPFAAEGQQGPPTQKQGCVQAGAGTATVESEPWGQARMRVEQLRDFATGAGQKVAVIDTGVTPHPRLAGRLQDGGDYVLGKTALNDCDGHGTVVAGIIAAADDPATGFTGVAPEADILSIRQSSLAYEVKIKKPSASKPVTVSPGNTSSMALAIKRAVNFGATVINISEAACFPPPSADQAPFKDLQAAVSYAAQQDVVVVAAAGNVPSGSCSEQNKGRYRGVNTVAAPAWYDENVLAVGAAADDGTVADFSLHGPWVDVMAPGTKIVSLDPAKNGDGLTNVVLSSEGKQQSIQGTSFAAPYVSGVVALVRQAYPDLDAGQVVQRIERTAQSAGGQGAGNWRNGQGMINPMAALTSEAPPSGAADSEPAQLQGLQPVTDDAAEQRRIALLGAGTGFGVLAITLLALYTARRSRRNRRSGAPTESERLAGTGGSLGGTLDEE